MSRGMYEARAFAGPGRQKRRRPQDPGALRRPLPGTPVRAAPYILSRDISDREQKAAAAVGAPVMAKGYRSFSD